MITYFLFIMYFNQNNNFYHGIMFHHFHDNGIHSKGQGSIDKDDFYKMINFIGRNNILDADVFFEKFKNNKLKENEVCLTFDDAIKCQIDIALPVLEDLKIKSFFFVYTSIFEGKPDNLEFFRYFRMNYFKSVDEFYDNFYKFLDKNSDKILKLSSPFIEKAIYESCKIKKNVVEKDEKDKGLRKILNFGHTFAHAYEASLGYSKKLNHGEAVILGMKSALN